MYHVSIDAKNTGTLSDSENGFRLNSGESITLSSLLAYSGQCPTKFQAQLY